MKLKKKMKVTFNFLLSKSPYAVTVASCGRSGSTMLTRAIARSAMRDLFRTFTKTYSDKLAEKTIIDYAWQLEETFLRRGFVYKTHDYPPKKIRNKNRYIYTYSSPVKVIPSVIGKASREGPEWMQKHALRLNGNAKSRRDIIENDSLNLVDNISSWLKNSRKNILCIKYKNIWKRDNDLSSFLGIELELPKKKSRKSSVSILEKDEIEILKGMEDKIERRVGKDVFSK